jgi:hypothetical protein
MFKGMKKLTVLITCALLTGCITVGPKLVSGSRTDYNVVLRQADDEQMLLNLVRLRYRDRSMFLELSALNTQFSVTSEVEAGSEFGRINDFYGLGGTVTLEEAPTVSYTPLRGADFVQRVLTPISLETLILLDTSGWNTERVVRLLVDRMNQLENAKGANGPTPMQTPDYKEFKRMAFLLRQLEWDGLVIGAVYENQIVLNFEPEALQRTEYMELVDMLDLNPDQLIFPLTVGVGLGNGTDINLRFRSFSGVMYFLSQSVQVPEADTAAGRVTITKNAEGDIFDWQQVTNGLMTIKSSPKQPKNAAVAVFYRNSWFYIDDSDLDSKSTFSLLGQVYQLQAGNTKSIAPTLTLPVGR